MRKIEIFNTKRCIAVVCGCKKGNLESLLIRVVNPKYFITKPVIFMKKIIFITTQINKGHLKVCYCEGLSWLNKHSGY